MRKAQVFLEDKQLADLKRVAKAAGRKQSEIIRRGVEVAVIEAETAKADDWRAAILSAAGVWEDRDDLDALYGELRRRNRVGLERLLGE